MRSTFASPLQASIFVEGLRARPAYFVVAGLIAHAVCWSLSAWIADPTPHPKLAIGAALGREWQRGYLEAPPLPFWICEIAYKFGGLPALYMLGPLCVALAGWFAFLLARRVVGDRYGALATFLLAGVHPAAFPVGAFDSDILMMPLMALAVLLWWIAVAEQRLWAWLPFGFVMGVSLYAGVHGIFLFAVLIVITVGTQTGRACFRVKDMLFVAIGGLFTLAMTATPRVLWLMEHRYAGIVPEWPVSVESAEADASGLAIIVLLGHIGLVALAMLSAPYFAKDKDNAPLFVRPPLLRFGRVVAISLAIVPLSLALIAVFVLDRKFPPAALAPFTMYSGLLLMALVEKTIHIHRQRIVAVAALTMLFLPPLVEIAGAITSPFFSERGRATNWPAASAARFVTDVFRTRTGQKLEVVAGELTVASTVALLSRDRPHVLIDGDRARSPWIDETKLRVSGAVAIWRIERADAAPPAKLTSNLPALKLEAPVSNNWVRPGNLDFARFGWAILAPDKSGN